MRTFSTTKGNQMRCVRGHATVCSDIVVSRHFFSLDPLKSLKRNLSWGGFVLFCKKKNGVDPFRKATFTKIQIASEIL